VNRHQNSQPRTQKRYTLLTGATGLLGRYIMRDLLLKGHKLAVLVRPTKKAKVRERIETILQMWEDELGYRLPRPVLLTGDIGQKDMGMSQRQLIWSKQYLDQVVHGAAVLKFHGENRQEEPWLTNLGGTENVLAFSQACEVRHFHYISTAYVCGKRDDVVFENQLDMNQEFRNDYERSKFTSESLVQAADCFETTTVYRPGVIVGDSENGYTSTYHGLFLYLRLLSMLVPEQKCNQDGLFETPIQLPIEGNEPRNLVPVDWASKTISHLICTPEAHGRTYHLVPDKCTNAREVIEFCYDYFHSAGVEFCGAKVERSSEDEFAQKLFENTSIYASYETSDPNYDKSNVIQFAGHLVCPPIDKQMIFKFLDFGKQDAWGKVKPKPPKVARWIESHLTEIALAAQKTMGALRINGVNRLLTFGLDIHGPGGGQWQLASIDGKFEVTPGLPDDSCPILKLSDLQINDLLMRGDEAEIAEADEVSGSEAINWTQPLESVMGENHVDESKE
jgi:thioester reductase-like protein